LGFFLAAGANYFFELIAFIAQEASMNPTAVPTTVITIGAMCFIFIFLKLLLNNYPQN
jgi:hypothetical protein